jgi:hypothetical protein
MDHGQKKVWSSNNSSDSFLPISSREGYVCANASITKGVTGAPATIQQCFERFPYIANIADALGVTLEKTVSGQKVYNFWTGPGTGPAFDPSFVSNPVDLNLPKPATECDNVNAQFGDEWLGCLWGSPEASFSCICPYVGDKYEAYLKHRLTVATFWNTPKYVPVQRREFLDEIRYGRQITITISGDFNLSLGDVVEVNVTAASGYPYGSYPSSLNGKYWVLEIKHVINSGGTHETRLKLGQMAVSSV